MHFTFFDKYKKKLRASALNDQFCMLQLIIIIGLFEDKKPKVFLTKSVLVII